jgi:hypothetical protein
MDQIRLFQGLVSALNYQGVLAFWNFIELTGTHERKIDPVNGNH